MFTLKVSWKNLKGFARKGALLCAKTFVKIVNVDFGTVIFLIIAKS
jgi:hypothetical protein